MACIDIGAQIKRARVLRGWSTVLLAELAGCRRQELNLWERGKRRVSLDVLVRLGEALGVPASYLLRYALKEAGLATTLQAAAAQPTVAGVPTAEARWFHSRCKGCGHGFHGGRLDVLCRICVGEARRAA